MKPREIIQSDNIEQILRNCIMKLNNTLDKRYKGASKNLIIYYLVKYITDN